MYETVVYWQHSYYLKWCRAKLFELLFQLLLISFLVSCLVWSLLLCERWQSLCCVDFLGGLWTTYRLSDLLSWSLISTHPLSTYTAHFHLLSARLLPFHRKSEPESEPEPVCLTHNIITNLKFLPSNIDQYRTWLPRKSNILTFTCRLPIWSQTPFALSLLPVLFCSYWY